ALSFCSPRLQMAQGSTLLLVTDLIGKKYEFTVPADGYTYLSPEMVIVKAYHERIENYRVELIFTLLKENGIWFIDDMEMMSTPIPSRLSFFVEAVKVGLITVGTDKSTPVSLTTPTPTFEVIFNSDAVNLDSATWTVRITDQNTFAVFTNATPAQFSILPSGSKAVLITVENTPNALQAGGLYAFEFSSPSLRNASETSLTTPNVHYFQVSGQQAGQAPTVQGISSGLYKTDQTFTIATEAGKTYSYSLDNGTSWLTYSGPVTLSTDGTYIIIARENATGQIPAPLSTGISLIIDKTAPLAPTVSGITAGTFNTAQTFQVAGAEANGTLYYSLDNGTTPVVYSSAVTVTNPGTYQVVAWQVDAAGNVGARTNAIGLTIDKTAPLAPTVSGITAGTFTTAQTF
ncbi:MAG TPA: chitobiase/beta-hexosaminidase C-terminal domain-containing protein, partial [Candidatus Ozemobacteraceae bacterium]|nr:chitobiase/beta-hexosaminidase C-terminal domain-containing protein [Candidatus Ozemobacteraceae bacterium]